MFRPEPDRGGAFLDTQLKSVAITPLTHAAALRHAPHSVQGRWPPRTSPSRTGCGTLSGTRKRPAPGSTLIYLGPAPNRRRRTIFHTAISEAAGPLSPP